MDSYTGARYEYAILIAMMGTEESNWQNPPMVLTQGVTVEADTPFEALSELGLLGWNVVTTTTVALPELTMGAHAFVIHTLSRVVQNN